MKRWNDIKVKRWNDETTEMCNDKIPQRRIKFEAFFQAYVKFLHSHPPITETFRFCLIVYLYNMFQPLQVLMIFFRRRSRWHQMRWSLLSVNLCKSWRWKSSWICLKQIWINEWWLKILLLITQKHSMCYFKFSF